ncbi:MAG: translocation/assembly module TamB domain-containing protein, partial [Gemmatimonadota bacterium]
MAGRRAWWTGLILLAVAVLVAGTWRLAREIPERMRSAGEAIREAAAARGLKVSFRNLRFHVLTLSVSVDDLSVEDALAGLPLARCESADASLSLRGILSGGTPVSRIRVRNFAVAAGEGNRALFEKLRAAPSGGGGGSIPEILLVDGHVRIGPLGPARMIEARVRQLRVRPVRFLGTRVSVDVDKASGDLAIPAAGAGRLPFDAAEADLYYDKGVVRLRRLIVRGPSATLRASGIVDTTKRTAGVKASGTADIARWIAAGAPGGRRLAEFAARGELEFSVAVDGPFADPAVDARAVLANGRFGGDTPADGEISLAVSGGRLRVESLHGRLWGGTLAGRGWYDLKAGAGEGTLALSRAVLGRAPWERWGLSFRPAGAGDVAVAASGGPGKVAARVSVSLPDGLERAGAVAGGRTRLIHVPLSANASVDIAPGRAIDVAALDVRAGNAELSGSGAVSRDGRTVALSGRFSAPAGRAADYGWDYPLAWAALSGEWDVRRDGGHPRVAAGVRARGLAMRALPPVAAAVKIEGDPAGLVHFVADVPAEVVSVTASGTVTGPLSEEPFLLEATVGARGIEFARCGPWVAAVLASLGRDPSPAARLTAGLEGTGTADLQLSVRADAVSLSGTAALARIASRGLEARAVLVDGSIAARAGTVQWTVKAGGVAADGTFALEARGADGETDVTASLERVDLGTALSAVSPEYGRSVKGPVALRLGAHHGPRGWEIGHFAASAPKIESGGSVFAGVKVEGALGAAAGSVAVAAASPAVKISADVRRGGGWPARIRVAADNVPTAFLAGVMGRGDLRPSGTWTAEGEGTVRLADLFEARKTVRESIDDLRFSVHAADVGLGGAGFESADAEGRKEGDAVTGRVRTRSPDTDLAFSVALREPFAFRLDGPFAFGRVEEAGGGPAANGGGKSGGKARLLLSGQAHIAGVLGAPAETRGTLRVGKLEYRAGGIDVAGRDISVLLEKDGARWGGGDLEVAGTPLRVSGKVGWGGDLDARLEGAIPAATIRLVTDVFERLDGTMRIELRVTGHYKSPSVAGKGYLEGGIFSFRGYGQLFEEMTAEAVISREKIVFEHFEGRSGGGYLDGHGELPLRFGATDKLFFSVDFFDMRYPYPEEFRPTVQGHVELIGPADDLLVTGEAEVQSARYTKSLEPESALLDFRRRFADVTARREKSAFRVRLDIDVAADGTIRVKNNLCDAEAEGEFKVVGDTSRVVILGSFDVIEGTISYRGNRYEIEQLNVDFQDPRRNNPRI